MDAMTELLPDDAAAIPSPALVIRLDRMEANLSRLLAMVPSPDRLRPHVKTHKLPQVVGALRARGVTKAKAATVAEAEMAAGAGAEDVLLAVQPVGPAIDRLLALQQAFPAVRFAALTDAEEPLRGMAEAAARDGATLRLFLDLDVGQHRTGVAPGPEAVRLYQLMASLPSIEPAGLHAYDGHLTQSDAAERAAECEAAFAPVAALRSALLADGLPVPAVVAGGSPTFPMHARRPDVECSPGTWVFWDAGYARKLPDLPFAPAACLLTRVISRPGPGRLCLDLGHKAVGSEMSHPRVVLPDLPDAVFVLHNEEHLVVETARAAAFPPGSLLAAIPWHICPTVALHGFVHAARPGAATEVWPVTARTRRLTF